MSLVDRAASMMGLAGEIWTLVRRRLRGVPPDFLAMLDRGWLREIPVRTVLDIGANAGQFALAAHAVFPSARIHSFEPLPDCFRRLELAARRIPRIEPWNLALGDHTGSAQLQSNEFSPSSSLLALAAAHRAAFPFAAKTSPIEVRMAPLDSLAEALRLEDEILVKIDVQGYEDRVLRGGERTIRRARILLVETSFEILYEGQMLHSDICRMLEPWGFRYSGALDQLLSPTSGKVLSADSVFLRAA